METVNAAQVRELLRCLETEITRTLAAGPAEQQARLVRLRVMLLAAQHAKQPMGETCRGVCVALRAPLPLT